MKLQNLTIIFIVIMLPIILIISLYISNGLKTIQYQSIYDNGLASATSDAIYAFETNSAENIYSDNAETKRSIIKSSVKMFEKSLCNTCNISSYNTDEIEEYIPAILFGMYDGFYMYAPSYNSNTGKYEHSLKNYVYYSETLDDGTVIRYSLDNYVSVTVNNIIKEGYLIDLNDTEANGTKYKGIDIDVSDTDAVNYYKDAYEFTDWFLNKANIQVKKKNGTDVTYLNIGNSNDPEDPNSAFVKHKREIIRNKIEGVLNSTITAYSNKTWGQNYKMPKFSEEDWEKIYNNISVTSFFQGKKIGLTKYNGYCVLNSTNSSEYVNPSLMYFIYNNEYHDIRCSNIENIDGCIKGYRIGSFQRKTIENEDGTQDYKYEHNELACYNCINGALSTSTSVYDYIKPKPDDGTDDSKIKTSYWTSLARERYNQVKLTSVTKENINNWEQIGEYIYGKTSSGEKIIKLKLGDYIDYKCNNTNTYTVAGNTVGYGSSQTFEVQSDIKWRILGVEEGKLLIVSDDSISTGSKLILDGQAGYANGPTELNKICALYGNGNGATSARSIKVSDFINLCNNLNKGTVYDVAKNNTHDRATIPNGEKIEDCYGADYTKNSTNETRLYCYYINNNNNWVNDFDHPDGSNTNVTDDLNWRDTRVIMNAPIIQSLICSTNRGYAFADGIRYYANNEIQNYAIYSVWKKHVYGTALYMTSEEYKSFYIRPVVKMKADIELVKNGTFEKDSMTFQKWSIQN